MKKVKTILQACFTMLAVVAVVGLTKMDTKAAQQITGLKQVYDGTGSVEVEWNSLNTSYECPVYYYRIWGSNADFQRANYESYMEMVPGTTYELYVEVYNDYDREPSQLVGISPRIEVVTTPGKNTSFAVKQTAAGTSNVTLSWNACPGANCYELEYPVASGEKRVDYVEGTSVTLTGLKKNADSYVSVTPCRKALSTGYIAEASSTYASLNVAVVPSKPGIQAASIFKKKAEISVDDKSIYYADGYTYDIYKVKGNKKIKTIKTTSVGPGYSNKAFAKKDLFKVRVKSYSTGADGTKYYTGWSSWYYFSTHDLLKSAEKKGSGITVKWNKINGASGYKVYASNKSGKGYKVVATIKKGSTTSTTFKKYNKKALKKGKTYYVYVEPTYKSGKKNIDVVNGYYRYTSVYYK